MPEDLGHPGVSLYLDRTDGVTDGVGQLLQGDISPIMHRWIHRARCLGCSSNGADDVVQVSIVNQGTSDSAAQVVAAILYADNAGRLEVVRASTQVLVPRSSGGSTGWRAGEATTSLVLRRPPGYEPQRAIAGVWDLLFERPSAAHKTFLEKTAEPEELFKWTQSGTIDSRIASRNWSDQPMFAKTGNVITLRGRLPVEIRARRYDATASPMILVKQGGQTSAPIGPINGGYVDWAVSDVLAEGEVAIRIESNFGGIVESNQAGLARINGIPAPADPATFESDYLELWMDDHPTQGLDLNDFIVQLRC